MKAASSEDIEKDKQQDRKRNCGEGLIQDQNDEFDANPESSSASRISGIPLKKKKKKKSKKRHKLEKRKKRSDSHSSKSSDAFVSLDDIPGTLELQDPGFRAIQSSTNEASDTNKGATSRENDDTIIENLSDNGRHSDDDEDMINESTNHRDSDSESSSSSSNNDTILRQARFGPRNRMMRARIRAQEEASRENESDTERPPPLVLSKPAAKNKYSFFRDFIRRQYDSRPTHPWYTKNRIGSLDLVKRFELNQKLTGHEVIFLTLFPTHPFPVFYDICLHFSPVSRVKYSH